MDALFTVNGDGGVRCVQWIFLFKYSKRLHLHCLHHKITLHGLSANWTRDVYFGLNSN